MTRPAIINNGDKFIWALPAYGDPLIFEYSNGYLNNTSKSGTRLLPPDHFDWNNATPMKPEISLAWPEK